MTYHRLLLRSFLFIILRPLIAITLVLSLNFPATPAVAKNNDESNDKPIVVKKHYTCEEFFLLPSTTMKEFEKRAGGSKDYKIGSMSYYQTIRTAVAALKNKRGIQRLVKDMEKIKSKRERVRRLAREVERQKKLHAKIKAHMDKLKKENRPFWRVKWNAELAELTKVKVLIDYAERWQKNPMDGVRK